MNRKPPALLCTMALVIAQLPSVLLAQIDSVTLAGVASRHQQGDPGNDLRSFVATADYLLEEISWDGVAVPQDDGFGGFPTWGSELSVRITHVPSGESQNLTLGAGADFAPAANFAGASSGLRLTEVSAGDPFQFEFFEAAGGDDPGPDPDAIWDEIRFDFFPRTPPLFPLPAGTSWAENGNDAPAWPAAQSTSGRGDLELLSGTLDAASGDYVDTFLITVSDPATFRVTADPATHPQADASFDTRLWLFDQLDNLVMANDDNPLGTSRQALLADPSGFPGVLADNPGSLIAGETYLLAVGGFNNDPEDAAGNDLATLAEGDFTELWGANPDAGPFAAWEDAAATSFDGGFYVLSLSGSQFQLQIPEPAALGLACFACACGFATGGRRLRPRRA